MNRKLILSAALSGLMLTATAQTTVAPAIPRDGKVARTVGATVGCAVAVNIGGSCHPMRRENREEGRSFAQEDDP